MNGTERDGAAMEAYRAEAIRRGADAVQEEFDERGLGSADLLVEVIVDELGLLDRLAGAVDALGLIATRPYKDETTPRQKAEEALRRMGVDPSAYYRGR